MILDPVKPPAFTLSQHVKANHVTVNVTYSVGEVFNASLKDKVKDWVKICRYTAVYVGHFYSEAPEGVFTFASRMGEFKNFLSIRDVYKKTQRFYDSFQRVAHQSWENSALSVFLSSTDLMTSVVDGLSFASRFTRIDSTALQLITRNTNLAQFVGCIISAGKNSEDFLNAAMNEKSSCELQLAIFLRLSIDISYIALGIISFGFPLIGVIPSAIAFTNCTAMATVLSLTVYFLEKMYDPHHKNSDVNWDAFKGRVRFEV